MRGNLALWFDQPLVQRQAKQDAQGAKDDERPSPAVVLADESREEAARDRTNVNAGLMKTERARTRFRAVIIAQQRHGGGEVECFAQTFRTAKENQCAEVA